MDMQKVIEGIIADTVNERLKKVQDEISKELDGITNKSTIISRTASDEDTRVMYRNIGESVTAVKDIVMRKLDEAMTPAHPSGKSP